MVLGDIGFECMDWMHLFLISDQWWALLKTVMNLRVPLYGICGLSEQPLSSEEGLCSME
jgi:hypothetical protein